MAKVREHLHKLKRIAYSTGTKVYFCIDDCSYKVEVPFALGKLVRCNVCDEPFQMNENSIRLARPHCNGCGKMQVKGPDGKRKLIDKSRPIQAIAELGKSAVSDLRTRMNRAVIVAKEEDL